jgi:hypothetical protein
LIFTELTECPQVIATSRGCLLVGIYSPTSKRLTARCLINPLTRATGLPAQVPKDIVLFEAITTALGGKQILNDYAAGQNGDFGP